MAYASMVFRLGLAVTAMASLGDFKVYPGARSEPWLVQYRDRAMATLKKLGGKPSLEMWITDDSFEEVRRFYAALAPEHRPFAEAVVRNLSERSGRAVRATYFILDQGDSPLSSSHYVSIQSPVIIEFEPLQVKDVTLITRYRKSP